MSLFLLSNRYHRVRSGPIQCTLSRVVSSFHHSASINKINDPSILDKWKKVNVNSPNIHNHPHFPSTKLWDFPTNNRIPFYHHKYSDTERRFFGPRTELQIAVLQYIIQLGKPVRYGSSGTYKSTSRCPPPEFICSSQGARERHQPLPLRVSAWEVRRRVAQHQQTLIESLQRLQ